MPRRSTRAQPLTIDEIAETTLVLADRDGLDRLTMRALGAELRCDPMAIYRHVADRDALLALVATLVIAEIDLPQPSGDVRADLLRLADNARETFHRHPNVMVLIGHSQLSAATGLGVIEYLVDAFEGPDLPGGLADRINAYLGAVIGYVTIELSPPVSRPKPLHLHQAAYPRLAANAEELGGRTFGLRSENEEIVPLPGGFRLLMETLVAALLPQP